MYFGGGFFISKNIKINHNIKDSQVRVIGEDGQQLGIMSAYEANKLAEEKKLDLVKINPTVDPPVCKIMDYGRFKFETMKRERENKKNHRNQELKEISLSMNIHKHDLETKANNTKKLLSSGYKIKVILKMRGREQAHSERGIEVLQQFYSFLEEVAIYDKMPVVEGRNIVMFLIPISEKNKKKEKVSNAKNEKQ